VADAQPLVRPALGPAVADLRLGGCTFVLPGNAVNDNNLTVAFETGTDAASRYSDVVHGTFTVGSQTMKTGTGISTPLAGVGDEDQGSG
jgi:hypothetical protein